MERAPDAWRKLQHAYIKTFPKATCSKCDAHMCLQCGESGWHDGQSCEEHYSEMLVEESLDEDFRATLRWKIENRWRLVARSDGPT